jgi:hypothetical protein
MRPAIAAASAPSRRDTTGGPMQARFSHSILFVADMGRAIAFYRDVMGLPLKFQSPSWSEFETGSVTLALHPASERNPPGRVQ